MCDTSVFTAQVSGIGTLYPPNSTYGGAYTLDEIGINIVSDHPQTLQVSITAPDGTSLLLTAFNGAGGQNYTNTVFSYYGNTPITSGTAPFTGSNWVPQGGTMDIFDYVNANGTWTVTVIDTSCVNGGTGPNGTWTQGTFNGGGSGGFQMAFSAYYNPCGYLYNYYTSTEYLCQGDSMFLQSSNVGNVWWSSGPGNFNSSGYASVSGIYYFSGYDSYGCSITETIDVIVVPPPNLGADTILYHCAGNPTNNTWYSYVNSLNLQGPTWTYVNGSYASYSTLSNLSSGDILTLINMRNTPCADTVEVEFIVVDQPAQGNDTSLTVCGGTGIDLTLVPDTIGANPIWTLGGAPFTTPQSTSQSGSYTLISESIAGCTDTMNISLSVDTGVYGPNQNLSVCSDSVLDLSGLYPAVSGAQWYYQGGQLPNVSSISSAGDYTLVASSNGCTDSATVSVLHLSTPNLGLDTIMSICNGEQVDLSTLYQSPATTLVWANASGTALPSPLITQTGVYTVTASSANGCSDLANANITVLPTPTLAPDTTLTICDGTLLDLTQLNASIGNSVQWSQGGIPLASTTDSFNGQYTIMATTSAGCVDSASATVNVNPIPNLGPDQTRSICSTDSADLSTVFSTAGLSTSWSLNGTVVNDVSALNTAGDYLLIGTNNFSCADSAIVELIVNMAPNLGPDQFYTLCPWQTLDLTNVFPLAGLSADYSSNGIAVINPTMVHDQDTYMVDVVDVNGCADQAWVVIDTVDCLCEADFSYDASCFQEKVSFNMHADSAIIDAYWQFSDGSPDAQGINPQVWFNSQGVISATLVANLSCGQVIVEQEFELGDCSEDCDFWTPNSFTPDGDGINDTWRPVSQCVPLAMTTTIFNRFGNTVYSSNSPTAEWGGANNPVGVYIYQIQYQLPYQERKLMRGVVNLVR